MADDILKGIQINSKGYGTISKIAMQDRNLHITAKAIYAYFNSFSGGGDSCFPTRAKICYDLGISNDTFGKYLKQLVNNGYIEVEQVKENGRFSHNVYTICSTILPCPKISDTENIVHDRMDTNNNNNNNNNNFNINKENKKERKKENSFDEILKNVENSDLKELYIEYIKMRKLIKKPMTDRALRMLMKKVNDLEPNSIDRQKKLLENAIVSNWLSVYPLKDNGTYSTGYSKPNYSQPAQPKKEETEEEIQKRQHEQYLRLCEEFGWDPDADVEEVEEKSPEERLREIYEEQERVREGRKREWT